MSRPIVVVKVGGSLLDWPDLPARLSASLQSRSNDRIVLVIGGGRFADVLRDLDAVHRMGETAAHALALRVLDLTAHLLARLIPGTTVVDLICELDEAWSSNQVPILAPRRFLDDDDRSADPLPHAWTTTTDSIAARLAVRIQAAQLVLLKSTEIPKDMSPTEAAKLGLVDPQFPKSVEGVPRVSYINLRRSDSTTPIGTSHRPT